jgi:hypothetical protein
MQQPEGPYLLQHASYHYLLSMLHAAVLELHPHNFPLTAPVLEGGSSQLDEGAKDSFGRRRVERTFGSQVQACRDISSTLPKPRLVPKQIMVPSTISGNNYTAYPKTGIIA